MDIGVIIAGIIIALAIFYFIRKIRNTLKGGGCSGGCGCGCGCSTPSEHKKSDDTEKAKCSCKD